LKKIVIILFSIMLVHAGNVYSWGAIALGNQDKNYGASYNYNTKQQAIDRALAECGGGCEVVVTFNGGCAAFASEAGKMFPYGSGWSTESRYEAERIALDYCRKYGGKDCRIKAWSCEAH
jgi:hypothetical protein